MTAAIGAVRTAATTFFSKSYQACKSGIATVAQTVIGTPIQFGVAQCRKVMLFDIGFILTLRTINSVSQSTIGKTPFNPDALLTLGQQKRATELAALRERLKHRPGTLAFGAAVRNYLFDLIPSVVATKLYPAPLSVENWAHYKLRTVPQLSLGYIPLFPGYIIDYALDQTDRHTDFRRKMLESTTGKDLTRWFKCICTTTSHLLLSETVLDKFVNLEQILLNVLNKGHQPQNPKKAASMQQAILASLAASFSQQSEVDVYIVQKFCKPSGKTRRKYTVAEAKDLLEKEGLKALLDKAEITPAQAFIARLNYHSETNTLPKGLPDPKVVALTAENLPQELDNALNSYMSELIQKILDLETPQNIKEGLIGAIYFLEGKKILNEILTFVAVEIGIKQLVDPYMVAVAVLLALGHETMELEADGFGYDSHTKILRTGKAIILESFRVRSKKDDPEVSSGSMLKIFEQSGLRHAEGNVSAIEQRQDVKAKLKEVIKDVLYSIKDEQFREPDSWLKTAVKMASGLPVVGIIPLSMRATFKFFTSSWHYANRSADTSNMSFWEWIGKNYLGKDHCEFVAERLVNLIYNPSWRITLMQLINVVVEQFKIPEGCLPTADDAKVRESFKKIITFLFEELLGRTTFSGTAKLFKGNLSEWLTRFSGNALYDEFKSYLTPKTDGTSPVETILTGLTPTIKELTLYKRLADIFRAKGLHFKDDGKFWEMYIREYLNHKVHADLEGKRIKKFKEEQAKLNAELTKQTPFRRTNSPPKTPSTAPIPPPPTQQEISEQRNSCIDELLKMNPVQLRETLASITEFIPNETDWVKIARRLEPQATVTSASK